MKRLIHEIISQKPHLADPLRFYEKALRFMDEVKKFPLPARPDQNAYPPALSTRVLDSLSNALDLPEGSLSPLRQALELGEIDFTRLPLREVPAFSLPYAEDDLTMLLFLMSRPYFLALRETCRLDGLLWSEGKCPVCNAQPALSSSPEEGQRELHCSFCGTRGPIQRVQCPVCLTNDPARLNIFTFTGEEGFSVQTCDECKSYIKTVEGGLISRFGPDIADLMSLPLDIVVQQKGYCRRSPNPIGMMKLSANG